MNKTNSEIAHASYASFAYETGLEALKTLNKINKERAKSKLALWSMDDMIQKIWENTLIEVGEYV
jgi:uncharacterized protein YfeS